MKVRDGEKFICLNPDLVLSGYYDSKYEPLSVLIVKKKKIPKTTRLRGSNYFTKFYQPGKTPKGHDMEFACSRDQVNEINFQKQK